FESNINIIIVIYMMGGNVKYILLLVVSTLSLIFSTTHAEKVTFDNDSQESRLNYRNDLFSSNIGYSWLGIPTEEYDRELILGARKIYCAHTANILKKYVEANELYQKGLVNLDSYAEKLNVRGEGSTLYNSIIRYAKPPYVKGRDIIKGMIVSSITNTIDDQFYRLGDTASIESRQKKLKLFYVDNCTVYL
ncbi:hypothetical protein, partial [Acinetobacter faecalis]|uniref:hypothetical protein n=1 Tax=Acinetobacter faecalis TaxID=2665161 RepID=UPI002A91DCFE